MAKVKKDTVSPKKRGREVIKNAEPSTSKTTEKRSRSKSNASKKATSTVASDAEIDSGISSPEKSRRTSRKDRSSAASTISRISNKSKASIAKSQNKKLSDITWLKGLIQGEIQSQHKVQRTKSGIVVRYPSSLQHRVEDKIEYVTYPWCNKKCSGYVKIAPGLEKITKRTGTTMIFLILMGKILLLSGEKSTEFKSGTLITIPKGARYGLRNKSKETCFLRFQSICD
ncbi:uncharacterized protein LOC129567433 isoform X2 [Sitodiplosis mosellana]|uniref:uncharacterized protein LOC129567433 isoform X2 n=1 Tax=Sitodiplosis mosellana TaxID=263140 RepID=UPI0024439AF6|nr:uncharacterized protein LOC129567433 isoform X2 [Sitodiplosis mosellana]